MRLIDYNGMKEVTLKATLGNDYSSSLIDCVYDLTIGSLHKNLLQCSVLTVSVICRFLAIYYCLIT